MPKIGADSNTQINAEINTEMITKYQILFEKDPRSQVFAPLAEAYRKMGLLKEAEQTAVSGIKHHPQFVSGLVTYARILKDLGKYETALTTLQRVIQLSHDNLLAHRLMGEIHLATKNPKEALRAFKMLLFYNPTNEYALNAVSKLESLTADEYEDELFSMKKLTELNTIETIAPFHKNSSSESDKNKATTVNNENAHGLPKKSAAIDRMLSLIDAFIVRNELEKAHQLLKDTILEFGDNDEIEKRRKSLQIRKMDFVPGAAPATHIQPLLSREKIVKERKLEFLQSVLNVVENYR